MKRLWAAVLVVALSAGTAAAQTAPAATPAASPPAEPPKPEPTGPFGGNITGFATLTSDYRFRGISQTKTDIALQAGLQYEAPLKFIAATPVSIYGGFWGSTVNFSPDVGESIEIDLLAGVKVKALDEKLVLDLGWIGYRYPGARGSARLPYDEFGGTLSYDFGVVSVTGQVRWSPNFFAGSGDGWYKQVLLNAPLDFLKINDNVTFKAFAGVGHQTIQRNARFANPDYWDWMVGVVATVHGVDVGVTYIDTDIPRRRCNGGGFSYCAGRIVVSVGKSF